MRSNKQPQDIVVQFTPKKNWRRYWNYLEAVW